MLAREEERALPDLVSLDLSWPEGCTYRSGGGGDFGGGGADGAFDVPAQALAEAVGDAGGAALADVATGALEVADGADEGAIRVNSILAVFGAVLAVLLGGGWLLCLYFGAEALLAVAVELAFDCTAASTVVRVARQGWPLAAIRLRWKPPLGALIRAVAPAALVDHFVPQADSLPQAAALAGPPAFAHRSIAAGAVCVSAESRFRFKLWCACLCRGLVLFQGPRGVD